jgi:hypothetical protein
MKPSKLAATFLIVTLLFSFCKKEKVIVEAAPATPYHVRMTDAPAPYSAVNIDLKSVELTGNGKTVTLNTTPGIYNLLNFSNGVDTLIATGDLTVEKVQQIRLVLGPNNSVVSNGVTYPMDVPSGSESGLKLQVHHELEAGVAYEVLLDFDANQSVVQDGNGAYHLKPVIRTIQTAISGAISGRLSVPNVPAVITAGSNGVSYSSIPNAAGDFIIKGLPAGNYSVTVVPASPHNSTTINSVNVSTGVTATLGVVSI